MDPATNYQDLFPMGQGHFIIGPLAAAVVVVPDRPLGTGAGEGAGVAKLSNSGTNRATKLIIVFFLWILICQFLSTGFTSVCASHGKSGPTKASRLESVQPTKMTALSCLRVVDEIVKGLA